MIGDHVNLAARLQELTRTLGHPVLMTEFTASKLESRINSENPDPQLRQMRLTKLRVVTVKGRQEAVGAYAVARCDGEGRIDVHACVG
jgi:class 3 adenylate cyclase